MPSDDKLILQQTEIWSHDKEEMSIFGGKMGDLILTERNIIYIESGRRLRDYGSISDVEEAMEEYSHVLIPLDEMTGGECGGHYGANYLTINYLESDTQLVRHFFASDMTYFASDKWLECISEMGMTIRQPPKVQEKQEPKGRNIVLFDLTHNDYVGKTVTNRVLEICNERREKYEIEQPVYFKGKAKEEFLANDGEYLPRTRVLCLLGVKPDFTEGDLKAIERYVREGGKLILSADSPWNPPNPVAELFGFAYGEKKIEDSHA